MILIINTCKERLHYFEFVRPIEEVLLKNEMKFFTKKYNEVSGEDLEKSASVIICGTSLKDFDYKNNMNKFSWIKNFEKPLLGICAGMQIIGMIFEGKMKSKLEIGYFFEDFKEGFLGLKDKEEVYHLHNNYIDFSDLNFEIFSSGEIAQAVKHKEKKIYATLFHPEVRNKNLILNFCKLENNK
jgi:GMP synthase-like glutamine amidotransferase